MTLFVVVQHNKVNGNEYLSDVTGDGFTEYSAAEGAANAERLLEGDFFEVYVGKIVPVSEGD